MKSSDAAERKWACIAVSNVIQNDALARGLLQANNVVGTLITLLADGEEEVFIEAAGALRCAIRIQHFLALNLSSGIYVSMVDMISVQK
jgi:hypothetical protein